MVLTRALRQHDLHRPPDRARQFGRDCNRVGLERPPGRLAGRHRIGHWLAGRLGCCPNLVAARGRGQRFKPEMLRGCYKIGGRERSRSACDAAVVTAAEDALSVAVGQRIIEQWPQILRGSLARENWVRRLQRLFGGPPGVGDYRNPSWTRG